MLVLIVSVPGHFVKLCYFLGPQGFGGTGGNGIYLKETKAKF